MYEHRVFEPQPAPGSPATPEIGPARIEALIARGRRKRSQMVRQMLRSLGARMRRAFGGRRRAG